jgi:toxin ParE1/3/4
LAQLLDAPFTGRPTRVSGVRELVIAATPYVAVYRVEADTIVILNLFHTSQNR